MKPWLTVVGLAVGTAVIKAAGPLAAGKRPPSGRAAAVLELVAPALLAGLVVYETVHGDRSGLVLDARAVGLAAGALALAFRLPLTLVIVAAAAGAAAAHALA
jgi:hypothetical protein